MIIGRRDLHLAPNPRSGVEMTLLRMLAFRPADTGESVPASPPAASRAPRSRVTGAAASRAALPSPAAKSSGRPSRQAETGWQDPDWTSLLPTLSLGGAARLLAGNCAYRRREGDTLLFSLDSRFEGMLTPPRQAALAEALSKHYGEVLKVRIEPDPGGAETPYQAESRFADKTLEAARRTLEDDPNVQMLKSLFGAEFMPESIEVISRQRQE